jgi:DNA modification methylase
MESGGKSWIACGDNLAIMDALLAAERAGALDLIVTDPPFFTGKEQRRADVAYSDVWDSLESYLDWLRATLTRCHALLRETGSLFLHLDWRASHHARVLLDALFGEGGESGAPGFRNEIIWCYNGPGSPGMGQFNRKHDTILWYSKSATWAFNRDAVRVAHHEKTRANFRADLAGSGFVNPGYALNGGGKIPEDWWQFPVAARFPVDGETRVGYPTEKPLALVERIVLAASNPGDLVADFLCGGGTVPFAAAKHGRRFWASDASDTAVEMSAARLRRTCVDFEILGEVPVARA